MLDALIKSITDNPAIATAIGSTIAFGASEIVGASKLKSTGLIHLLLNIGKAVIQASIKKEGK